MGFTPTFYAGRPKLSEITIDSDLDMGGRNILRVGRIGSPYMPETWPTETLEWGDVSEQTVLTVESTIDVPKNSSPFEVLTWETPAVPYRWEVYLIAGGSTYGNMTLSFVSGDTTIHSLSVSPYNSYTIPLILPTSSNISLIAVNSSGVPQTVKAGSYVKNTGIFAGAKTFDLTGKWLALGLDMKGLAATIKIQGVEIPYSDYLKYFPIAPIELKIPGNWSPSQERPVIKVYK